MNWQAILRNQWFQVCLAAAICSAGAGIYDLAIGTAKNPPPIPAHDASPPIPSPAQYVTPPPSDNPSPVLVQLRAKQAGHWIVDASGGRDSDSGDLSQVVENAANGDTVTIRPGRYEASLVINKDLAFVGQGSSSADTLIYFNRDQVNVVRVEAGHVTFSDLQIEQNSNAESFALICVNQAQIELTKCSIRSKSTYSVSVGDDVQLVARDSAFSSSDTGYGVIFQGRAHGTVTRCNILGNEYGLEVRDQSHVQVDGCIFQQNGNQNGYGDVAEVVGSGAILDVTGSNFVQNTAAIYASESGILNMTGCTLENNGIGLEGEHISSGLICVQTDARATLTNLVCKSNKQGIAVLAAGKAQLNNVILSDTGVITSNRELFLFCSSIFLSGYETSATISKSAISDAVNNGIVVIQDAKALVENTSVSNSQMNGLVFGGEDGTAGYGTVTDSTVHGNHLSGIVVQSKSSITAKNCTIEKNQIGIQAGLPNTGSEFGGTMLLESSTVQNNIGHGAIAFAGSVINLKANTFKSERYDYLEQAGGIIRTAVK
jgi:parallel beta-helix repeat protein